MENPDCKEAPTKIMLGMSFFEPSVDEASRTAKAFSEALPSSACVVLGVETGDLTRDTAKMKSFVHDRLTEPWGERRLYIWDDSSDKRFFPHWPRYYPKPFGRFFLHLPQYYPKPFYKGFSYGGTVNRLLALAAIADCKYLIRIDPGTRPPYYSREMFQRHVDAIKSGEAAVTSGLYTDRIALRDDFVPRDKKGDYYEFVQIYTGVDPYRQITGGAAFTVGVFTGPPAIPFPGFTPVWASDDGFYASICGSKALLFPESRVHRSYPGQAARHGKEYPVRLASMVVLRQLFSGASEDIAIGAGMEFLQQLKERGFYRQFILADANAELKKRSQNIVTGWKNYEYLRKDWVEILQVIVRVASANCECYLDA
jgi:hypothetical protein